MNRVTTDPLSGPEEAATAARAAQAAEKDGATTYMEIGGVDVREMQSAHAQHPVLSRWHETTLRLIPDLQQQLDQCRRIIAGQAERIAELDASKEKLEERLAPCEKTGEGGVASAEPVGHA